MLRFALGFGEFRCNLWRGYLRLLTGRQHCSQTNMNLSTIFTPALFTQSSSQASGTPFLLLMPLLRSFARHVTCLQLALLCSASSCAICCSALSCCESYEAEYYIDSNVRALHNVGEAQEFNMRAYPATRPHITAKRPCSLRRHQPHSFAVGG